MDIRSRLKKDMKKDVAKFLSSLDFDRYIFEADIDCNIAHVQMLAEENIIDVEIANKIIKTLKELKKKGIKALDLDPSLEDIHMAIENYVTSKIGEEAGFMHIGKSRNDQVVTDLRLALKSKIEKLCKKLLNLIYKISKLASKHKETVMVGYTHLQHAQPTTFAHYLLAYANSLKRDYERLKDTYKRIDINPLGSAAMTTTTFPINRKTTTKILGFSSYFENSIDAVSSRDFIAETIFDLAMLATNISRICEELILWSTYEFGLIEIGDEFCSTSSIMPQKKNPDVAEIIRAKSSNLYGDLMSVMSILKALPHSYNRDLQEVTPHLWNSVNTIEKIIDIMEGMLSSIKINKKRGIELAKSNFSVATDIADLIVKKRKLPFRVAHKIVGKLVSKCIDEGIKPSEINSKILDEVSKNVIGKKLNIKDEELKKVIDPFECIKQRNIVGGPSPKAVEKSIISLQKYVKNEYDRW